MMAPYQIINALPAFKVFTNIQEFDDYLWGELKKYDPNRLILRIARAARPLPILFRLAEGKAREVP